MTGRNALAGLSLICAFALCALAAPSAFAAPTGTTAVECSLNATTRDFSDAHCDTTAPTQSTYGHLAPVNGTPFGFTGTNANTTGVTVNAVEPELEATINGLPVKIKCTKMSTVGSLENTLVGEEMRIVGSAITITYTGCTVTTPVGCSVKSPGAGGGEIKTNELKSISVEGTPMTQKFERSVGTVLAELEIATCGEATGTFKLEGTFSAQPSGQGAVGGVTMAGATLIVNMPKNASSTLKMAGQKVGLKQTETLKKGTDTISSTGP